MNKFTQFLLVFLISHLAYALPLTIDWDAPFNEALSRLKLNYNQGHAFSQSDLKSTSDTIWTFLKKKMADWKELVDFPLLKERLSGDAMLDRLESRQLLEDIDKKRERFLQKGQDYLKNVFRTKPATLVFTLKQYPKIIVKIDNRPPSIFSLNSVALRSYYDASLNAQKVQQEAKNGDFNLLFLPLEVQRDSKEAKVKVIFSEELPTFSKSEIDNRILLHKMIQKAGVDPLFKKRAQMLFEQMLTYICRVSFDDINFRNVPFTSDGRLAPFDTDSFKGYTGIFTFIETFFVSKILSKSRVEEIAQENCKEGFYQIDSFYPNQILDNLFDKNEAALNAMVLFLSRKSQGEPNHIQLRDLDATYGGIIEQAINAKLDDTDNKTLLGQRCDFVEPIVAIATKAIAQAVGSTRNEMQDADLVKQILEKARVQGRIFADRDIASLGMSRFIGLSDAVCF